MNRKFKWWMNFHLKYWKYFNTYRYKMYKKGIHQGFGVVSSYYSARYAKMELINYILSR